jgi:hypothetical protein
VTARARREDRRERGDGAGLGSGASERRGRDGNVCIGFLPPFFRCGMEEKMMGTDWPGAAFELVPHGGWPGLLLARYRILGVRTCSSVTSINYYRRL